MILFNQFFILIILIYIIIILNSHSKVMYTIRGTVRVGIIFLLFDKTHDYACTVYFLKV